MLWGCAALTYVKLMSDGETGLDLVATLSTQRRFVA